MNLGPKDESELAVLYPENQDGVEVSLLSKIVDLPVVEEVPYSEEAHVTLANIQLTQLEAGNPGAVAHPLYQSPMQNPLMAMSRTASMAAVTAAGKVAEEKLKSNQGKSPMTPPGHLRAPGFLAKQDDIPEEYLPFHPGILDLENQEYRQYFVTDKNNKVIESAGAEPVIKPKLLSWLPDKFFVKYKPHPANIVHPMMRMGL